MHIAYIDPISRAWNRMTKALFKPFNISKWFIVGFTAFLAGLLDSGGNGSGANIKRDRFDFGDVIAFPHTVWEWFRDHPQWLTLILFGIIVIIGLIILLTWLSSRGKFMFLDNVVHDRAKVTQPWHEFRKHGDSLFLWRLVYGLVIIAVIILIILTIFNLATDIYENDFYPEEHLLPLISIALLIITTILIFAYISLFLEHFIVPIMYKTAVSATQAWGIFLPLFSKYWFYFLIYGVMILFLYILVFIAIVFAGLFTCCCGFILLIIPYINSVVTLPISYTFRGLGPEFLRQFGEEFDIFPDEEEIIIANN